MRDKNLSEYDGIKIVLDESSSEIPINALKIDNGYSPGHWLYRETSPGTYIVYFDGQNRDTVWGYVDEINPTDGLLIYFTVPGNKKNLKQKSKALNF